MLIRARRGQLSVFCILCSVFFFACRSAAPAPSNVLLIVVDTLRADHLGAYGYSRPTSSVFDTLATRGTLFLRAHSTTSWTDPAVESLMTGEWPRVLQPGASVYIAPGVPTLADAFRRGGYRTGAIVANPFLSPEHGFAQGFDEYQPVSGWAAGFGDISKSAAEEVNAAALQWLDHAQPGAARPWFLYLHYMDPHWPYTPPPDTARQFWRADDSDPSADVMPLNRKLREHGAELSDDEVGRSVDLYDAAIAHFDAELGTLMKALGRRGDLSRTWICITADHGEEFRDHGGFRHARTLYEEVLHIPLLILPPDGGHGHRADRLVQITQIGRTLLDAAGVAPGTFPGRPLEPPPGSAREPDVLMAGLAPWRDGVHRRAVLRGHDKLIVTADEQRLLFDLAVDPGELHSTTAVRAETVAELERVGAASADALAQQPALTPEPGLRERMRALGYDF
jgi:arylsulfatase A-like enzyme